MLRHFRVASLITARALAWVAIIAAPAHIAFAQATAPQAPQLRLDAAPGVLTLRWNGVAGATFYRVLQADSATAPLRNSENA